MPSRNQTRPIILASGSPRRRELLTKMGYDFTVVVPDVNEDITGDPQQQVLALSIRKSDAVCPRFRREIVICADTLVAVDGQTLGKPESDDDARRMLNLLSGRAHQVFTGLCVTDTQTGRRTALTDVTWVRFRPIAPEEIDEYIATGEHLGKAGSYAIQGRGGAFVEAIDGSRDNVIGLPTEKLQVILDDMLA